jgi:hypothetical protein
MPFTVDGPIAYAASTNATAGTSSGTLVAAGAYQRTLVLSNASTNAVWLNVTGGAAVIGSGLLLPASGQLVFGTQWLPIPTSTITAIASASSGVGIVGS